MIVTSNRLALLFCSFVLAGTAAAAPPRCDSAEDKAALALASTSVQSQCECNFATSHNAYVHCTREIITDLVQAGNLPKNCVRALRVCSAKSTCGRDDGSVTCCRKDKKGRVRCTVKKRASRCKAPSGGSACASQQASCCEACNADGSCGGETPIRCCLPESVSGAILTATQAQCQELTPTACTAAHGTNIGPGECSSEVCNETPTTTTTAAPTTSTTVTTAPATSSTTQTTGPGTTSTTVTTAPPTSSTRVTAGLPGPGATSLPGTVKPIP